MMPLLAYASHVAAAPTCASQTACTNCPTHACHALQSLFTKHDDLAAAAAHMGVPPATLAAEVAAYNEAAATGRDQFDKTVFPARVDPAQPVYVATITPVVHYTMVRRGGWG